ncbi:MAG: hypothetical protein LUE93_01645 [Bacteroides sp.]|nr:hypothetical protein [Bacteroides sp.]
MANNTLSENIETATTVIKDVKEAITEKGVEIPQGTHATKYPEYIAQMPSKNDFEEVKAQVEANKEDIASINNRKIWGRELYGDVVGSLDEVGDIRFKADATHNIGIYEIRPNNVNIRNAFVVGDMATSGDGKTGARLQKNGSLILQTSEKDTGEEIYPKIFFYNEGSSQPTSSIRERYSGILSIPGKLSVGGINYTHMGCALNVYGTARIGESAHIEKHPM